jgi:hypothetical protein
MYKNCQYADSFAKTCRDGSKMKISALVHNHIPWDAQYHETQALSDTMARVLLNKVYSAVNMEARVEGTPIVQRVGSDSVRPMFQVQMCSQSVVTAP